MAIDTKAKRASVQAYTFGLMRPPPDGTVDAPDRATVAWFYAGISYITAPAAVFTNIAQEIGLGIARAIAFEPTETRRDLV